MAVTMKPASNYWMKDSKLYGHLTKQQRYRIRKQNRGECDECHNPTRPGKLLCAECAEKSIRRMAQRRKYYREHGLCIACGNPVEEGYVRHSRGQCLPRRRKYDATYQKSAAAS